MSSRGVVSKLLLLSVLFCGAQEDTGHGTGSDDRWIRLCTLTTSNGSSLMDVAMPCGVRVAGGDGPPDGSVSGSRGRPETADEPVEYVQIALDSAGAAANRPAGSSTVGRDGGDSTTVQPGNATVSDGEKGVGAEVVDDETGAGEVDTGDVETDTGDVETDTGDVETDDVETDTGDVETDDVETDTGDVETDDVETDTGDDDVDQPTYDEEVTVLTVEPDGGDASEERDDGVAGGVRNKLKHRRPGTALVTKVMLTYLSDARNQLYDKIHYLLNLLQRTFFNIKLNCRSRRNSIERPSLLNYNRKQASKKNPSLSSVIFEPTFERSLMTMSFLMFGVYVIQVVQKLIQTIQQPGETSFMSNSIFGKLSTASSEIF